MNDYEYPERRVSGLLPDRNGSNLPRQVQFFLSLCEASMASHRYQEKHLEETQTKFCEGVVDYWWDDNDDLVEPTLEDLWKDPFDSSETWQRWPSQNRIAYQKGAIVGYQLSERYPNAD